MPFVPNVKADLTNFVAEKAMDGLFYYVAKEEAAIRNNPAARVQTPLYPLGRAPNRSRSLNQLGGGQRLVCH